MVVCYVSYVVLLSDTAILFFFFKQKTAYEMRISDWSSDVCSSDLAAHAGGARRLAESARQGRRNRPPPRDGGIAGRTLHRARRTPPEPGSLPLRLARQSHRFRLTPRGAPLG